MPGFLLHDGAQVVCLHTGRAEPTVTMRRVKVAGMEVVVTPTPFRITGCTLPTPPTANGPCVTGLWNSAATRVRAGGFAVLLQDSDSKCIPTGTRMNVVVTQRRVRGT